MGCCGSCCMEVGRLAEEPPKKGPAFWTVVCAKCGK
jgi:hypothetical protein